MPIKKLKKAIKSVGKAIKKAPGAIVGGALLGSKLKGPAGAIVGGLLGKALAKRKRTAVASVAPDAEKVAEETGSRAPKSFEPEEIKIGGASFRKGGLVKDRMGRAMKKPGADAMGRAMKNPMKMMGGGMKKPKKMLGGGMTRGYKRGGMAKKGC